MDCELAREALSARLDGEREPVPSARVDEHVLGCAECQNWFDHVATDAHGLRRLARSRPDLARPRPFAIGGVMTKRPPKLTWPRWALVCAGIAQVALAIVQGLGLSVGLAHDQANSGHHLLNESTSWSVALGVMMVGAALWPGAAAGLAGVLTVFVGVLTGYVIVDELSGNVTIVRLLTHVPVAVGAAMAVLVWRRHPTSRPTSDGIENEPDIVLPHNASRGRRRGHLWPTDGSTA
nr:zf-HC2 domain-containing protein [Mycobacterium shigaense]